MKKFLISLIFAACIIYSSCSKEKSEALVVDTQKVDEVLNFKGNPGARVVAFKKHINETQIELVNSIINSIVPEMYMEDKKEEYAGIIAEFEYRVNTLFSIWDNVLLFQNIQAIDQIAFNEPSLPAPASGDCMCRWNSTCQAYADTSGPDCVWYGCTPTSSGCGFLWQFSCEGICGRSLA